MDSNQPTPDADDDVAHRRRVIYALLLFVGICVGYLIFTDHDEDLRIELGDKLLDVAGIIAIGYCLGQLGGALGYFTGGRGNAYVKRSVTSSEVVTSSGAAGGAGGPVPAAPARSDGDSG